MGVNSVSNDLIWHDINENINNNVETNEGNGMLGKDAFLKLLVTQLSNQDPLNPMEDKEFIAQMAQFSTLEQVQQLNENILSNQEEMTELLDVVNENLVNSSVQTIQELINIRNAINAYAEGLKTEE